MKKLFVPTILGVLLLTPVFALATTISGTVKGFNSVAQASRTGENVHIPAHIAATETAFVVLSDAASGKHYLIQNVDGAVLARLVNRRVRIEGDLDSGADSIRAKNIFEFSSDNSWSKVWASDVYDPIHRDPLGSHPILSGE